MHVVSHNTVVNQIDDNTCFISGNILTSISVFHHIPLTTVLDAMDEKGTWWNCEHLTHTNGLKTQ